MRRKRERYLGMQPWALSLPDRELCLREALAVCTPPAHHYPLWASLAAQMVKHLPAIQETRVQSLGWEDPLEKGMATYSCILKDGGAWQATVHGVSKS